MQHAAIISGLAFDLDTGGEGQAERYVVTLEDEGKELRLSVIDTAEPCFKELFIQMDELLDALVAIGAPISLDTSLPYP